MVASKKTLDALEDLGLNLYERKLYVALLSRGVSTAGELSEMTGVPRSRAYDVLESLAEKGFSIIKPAKPMEYVAVPPEEALENAKQLHKEEIEHKISRIEDFKETDAADELLELYNQGLRLVDPSDMAGTVKGRYNVHQQMGNMIRSAEKEIKLFATGQGLRNLHSAHRDNLQRAAESGVSIRILAHLDEETQDVAEELREIASVRIPEGAEAPRSRVMVVDDQKLAFSLTHDDTHPTQDTAFWTESDHAAADTFSPLFENVW